MSRTNETRHIKWHKTCKCKCRLDASVCNNKQRFLDYKDCKCRKEIIDKLVEECSENIYKNETLDVIPLDPIPLNTIQLNFYKKSD